MIYLPPAPTITPGHPHNLISPDRWEHFAFAASTVEERALAIADYCLAGWSVWSVERIQTQVLPVPTSEFRAVMYRAKGAGQ